MGSARYHFSGIGGAGMNPLALVMRSRGHDVQGSDRSFDRGASADVERDLRRAGIVIKPQDGTAVTSDVDRFVFSAAVEDDAPEMRAARALGIERVARPALLAEIVNDGRPGVAIAGTSGKSTITGMLAWILRDAGVDATVIGGAALVGEGSGCFAVGPADGPVIAEACESDGTLVGYRPAIGLVHNISRDHDEVDGLRLQFAAFADFSARLLINVGCPEAAALARSRKALTYGTVEDADAVLTVIAPGPHRALGTLRLAGREIALNVPQPGAHNLENAAAAALVALELDVAPPAIERALSRFPGVSRRFEVIGTTSNGIRVVDDYAHNAEKLRAAITTAQAGSSRVVAVFQPHGYGPARFLRPELRELLPRVLRPRDRFAYLEIFYAGGTVTKDISSRMLADDLPPDVRCGYAPDHAVAVDWIRREARAGDTVLIMGARDPSLPRLARAVLAAFGPQRSLSEANMTTNVRTSPPMYFPPTDFVLGDAVTCASLVEVAYDQYCQWVEQGRPQNWHDFVWNPKWPTGFTSAWVSIPLWGDAAAIFFKNPEPFGFAVLDTSRRGFLVFRGTESDADWYKDIEVAQTRYTLVTSPDFGRVHDGFFSVYASMSNAVRVAVDQVAPTATRFFFTGHSLGSALITLAVPDVMFNSFLKSSNATFRHYNFASPRVGNETFAAALAGLVRVPTFRIVNTEDVVPDVPLAVTSDLVDTYYYKHVGTPADFTAQYRSIGNNHSMLNSYGYAINHPTQPEGPIVDPIPCQPPLPPGLRKGGRPARARAPRPRASLRRPAAPSGSPGAASPGGGRSGDQ